jgi:signal transduction histidine kinase
LELASKPTSIKALRAPSHLCVPFFSEPALLRETARFIGSGIEAHEKSHFIGHESVQIGLRTELQKTGVDISSAERAGAVVFTQAEQSYLRTGHFHPEEMLAFWEKNAAEARRAGFKGVRAAADMSWVADSRPERLPEYECQLNLLVERLSLSFLCAYPRARIPPLLVREALATHPTVILGERALQNPNYVPPEAYLVEDRPRGEVEWLLRNLERSGLVSASFAASPPTEVFARAAIEADEAVRRATALELHDDLGQILTALHLSLASALEEGRSLDARELSEDTAMVGAALESVRRISLELRPAALDDLGLTAAVRSLATEQALRAGLELRLQLEELDAASLSSDVALAAFRIVQQAVANVVQHARAHTLTLEVTHTPTSLELSVSDDGEGFDAAAQRERRNGHIGLNGMAERAALVGGDVAIQSRPGAGTVIHATLPMLREGPS